MPDSPQLELESLFVRIFMKTEQFVTGERLVREGTGRIIRAFELMQSRAPLAASALDKVATSVTALGNALQGASLGSMGAAISGLAGQLGVLTNTRIAQNLGLLASSLTQVAAVNVTDAAASLTALGRGLQDSKLGTAAIAKTAANLESLTNALTTFGGFSTDTLAGTSKKVAAALTTLNEAFSGSKLGFITTGRAVERINQLRLALESLTSLNADAVTVSSKAIAQALARIGKSFEGFSGDKAAKALGGIRTAAVAMEMIGISSNAATQIGQLNLALQMLTQGIEKAKPLGLKTAQTTLAGIEALSQKLGALATPELGRASRAFGQLGTFFRAAGAIDVTKLSAPLGELQTFVGGLASLDLTALTKLDIIATAFGRITSMLKALPQASGLQLRLVGQGMDSLAKTLISFDAEALTKATQGLSRVGGLLREMRKAVPDDMQKVIDMFTKISAAVNVFTGADMEAAAKNMARLASLLRVMSNIQPMDMIRVGNVLAQFGTYLAPLATDVVTKATENIGKLTSMLRAITRLAALDVTTFATKLGTLGTAISSWANQLASSVDPGALKTLSKLGQAFSRMGAFARLAGVENLPPIIANTNITATAANRAAPAVSRLSGSFNNLGRSMIGARTSMSLTQLTMAGFAGFAVVQFGRFDMLLARAMARMGEFSERARETLGRGLMDLASRTTTDTHHLAPALGTFTATGMNQPAALAALPIAESLAAATGMDMARATRHLTSVLSGLGLASGDVTTHLRNLTQVSDQFMRASQLVDMTVEELSEAFNARFANALRQANVPIEQGIGLLAAYAEANVRGVDAGNRASLFLQGLEHALIGHTHAWQSLGMSIQDSSGHFKPMAEIVQMLTNRLAGLNPVQARALLEGAGFDTRVTQNINPLLGRANAVRTVTDAMTSAAGATERAAEVIRRSFGGQILILWNNIKNMAIDIGRVVAPAVAWLAEKIRVLAQWFHTLSPALQRVLVWGSLIAAAILFLGILGTIGTTILGWAGAVLSVLGVIFTFQGVMIGLAAIVVGTGIGWRNLGNAAIWSLGKAYEWLGKVGDALKLAVGFVTNFEENFEILSRWFDTLSPEDVGEIMGAIMVNLMGNFNKLFTWLGDNWRSLWADFSTISGRFLDNLGAGFVAFFSGLGRIIHTYITTVWRDAIVSGIENILPAIRDSIQRAFTPGVDQQAAIDSRVRALFPEGMQVGPTRAGRESLGALSFEQLNAFANMLSRTRAEQVRTQRRTEFTSASEFLRAGQNIASIDRMVAQVNRHFAALSAGTAFPEAVRRAATGQALTPEFRTQPLPAFTPLTTPTPAQVARHEAEANAMSTAGLFRHQFADMFRQQPVLNLPSGFNFGLGGGKGVPNAALGAVGLLGGASPFAGLMGPLGATTSAAGIVAHNMMAGMHRFIGSGPGDSGEPPQIPGGAKAGNVFQQLSLERFMVGGEATARIEQQVHDAKLDSRMSGIQSQLSTANGYLAVIVGNRVATTQPARAGLFRNQLPATGE
jgi:TP901 family phage tail tape measure protein